METNQDTASIIKMTTSKKLEEFRRREIKTESLKKFTKDYQLECLLHEWKKTTDKNFALGLSKANVSQKTSFNADVLNRRDKLKSLLTAEYQLLQNQLMEMQKPSTMDILNLKLLKLQEERKALEEKHALNYRLEKLPKVDSKVICSDLQYQMMEETKQAKDEIKIDKLPHSMLIQNSEFPEQELAASQEIIEKLDSESQHKPLKSEDIIDQEKDKNELTEHEPLEVEKQKIKFSDGTVMHTHSESKSYNMQLCKKEQHMYLQQLEKDKERIQNENIEFEKALSNAEKLQKEITNQREQYIKNNIQQKLENRQWRTSRVTGLY